MGMFNNRTVFGLILFLGCATKQQASALAFSPSNTRSRSIASFFSRGGALYHSTSSTSTEQEKETMTSTTTSPSAYEELIKKLENITQLSRASAVLGYDQLVFMPSSASNERAAQMAALAEIIHEKKTDPKLLELMDQAQAQAQAQTSGNDSLSSKDALRLIELERKKFLQNQNIPTELAAKSASLSASAYQDWVQAKEAKSFDQFAPTLQDCFETAMEIAKAKAKAKQALQGTDKKKDLYDQMLDEFEMGMSQNRIDEIFAKVQHSLVPLIQKVKKASSKNSFSSNNKNNADQILKGNFDIDKQKALSEKLVKQIGFNSDNGRIDVSVHPFTSSMSSSDVRITSRFRNDEWYQGLAGSIHEAGHAMYEQNLRKSALSIDSAFTMGTHESQSLFWERHIGLSKSFWEYATPVLSQTLLNNDDVTPQQVYQAVNALPQESLIRVEADELTYPLHVILRYNIEKDVIGGQLKVSDINTRWNQDMKAFLNVNVPSDDKGALQDVHWSAGAIGYFPTYLIGAICAAQLFHYCQLDIPNIQDLIRNGEFKEIQQWLTKKVHSHGKRYNSLDDLLINQLGEELNPHYFIKYLTDKYTELYDL